MKITHKKQQYRKSCGACCVSMIGNIPENVAIKLCKTDKNDGTYNYDVVNALKELGFKSHQCYISKEWNEHYWTFEKFKYPIYVSGFFKTRYNKRGRPRERNHAFVISEGYVYDPSEDRKYPIEAFNHVFDSLMIESIIIVEGKEI